MSVRTLRARVFGIAATASLGLAAGSPALVYTVDTVVDAVDQDIFDGFCLTATGTCSLRAAVIQSGWMDGDVTIVLPPGVYSLTSASGVDEEKTDLDVVKHVVNSGTLTIEGSGPASTVIDGNHADRVMAIGADKKVTLRFLTVRNGSSAVGGGIHNGGELTVDHCVIRDNTSTGFGGGIYNEYKASVLHSTIDGNSGSYGGGIFGSVSSTELVVNSSTISRNSATVGNGGGIYTYTLLRVTNSTIAENQARQNAGGISSDGQARVYNSTIVDNEADSDADPDGGVGGGIRNAGSLFEVHTSIVERNYRAAVTGDDCSGGFDLYGNNAGPYLWFSDTCALTQIGPGAVQFDLFGDPPLSLRSNGGPTETVELGETTSLIDGSHPSVSCNELGFPLTRDQRFSLRPQGARCDIGAFEVGGLPQGLIFADGFATGDRSAW